MAMSEKTPYRAAETEGDPRWGSVVSRSAEADGSFWYSVRTTGVYCRPSCPARVPRPENVRFHGTREDAERAGFRPCRRCRPERPSLTEQHAATVTDACRFIETSPRAPRLGELAARAGLSPFHFHRVFKALTGLTPRAYAAAHRGERVRQELSRTRTVTAAIYDSGYGSNARFYGESE
jgi:AraC family transcriptional regulator of adaptative response/methylated-DNA-[protein]-cysteine methyltransferase